jgi:DNA-binding transcriptional LysR family regulator
MELRHLRYFVAVAEELHFRRAAERLHIAQPAVSEQVRKLEQELGVQLLERTQRRVALTEPGEAFLDEARRILGRVELARLAACTTRERAMSRLRIGYAAASLPGVVPRALQRLAATMPRLEASMEEGDALELVDDVRTSRLHAAIVSLPAPTSGLRVTLLGEQRAVAALPVRHRHAVQPELRLTQLAPERIVVLPRDANRGFYDAVVASCREAGLAPTLLELPDGHIERALLAVAAGLGMALLPEAVAERYVAPGVRFVPLAGAQPGVGAAVLTRRDSMHLPTVALVRALARAVDSAPAAPAGDEARRGVLSTTPLDRPTGGPVRRAAHGRVAPGS